MITDYTRSLALCLGALTSFTVNADHFQITVGGFYSNQDSGLNVSPNAMDRSMNVDFESDLKLAENAFLPYVAVQYWFNDRHAWFADYRQLHRGASRKKTMNVGDQLSDIIDVEGTVSSQLATNLELDIARIGYGYEFYQGEHWDIGLTMGLHIMHVDFSIDGQVAACIKEDCVDNSIDFGGAYITEVSAPLPDVGMTFKYQLEDNWQFKTHLQYFYLKVDEYSGHFIDFKTGVEWQWHDNWLLDISYKHYEIAAKGSSEDASYTLHYHFSGPSLGLSVTF